MVAACLAGVSIVAGAGDPVFLIASRTPLAGYLQATGTDLVLDEGKRRVLADALL